MEYDNLENEVEDLKKQLWHLSKKVIPALESKIENSSSGSGDSGNTGSGSTGENPPVQAGEKNWETLYDFFSEDPNLKWEDLSIRSGSAVSANLPDISLFKELRFVMQVNIANNLVHFVNYFDITSPNTTILSFSNFYYTSMPVVFGFDIRIIDKENSTEKTLKFNKFYKIYFNLNKYVTSTDPGNSPEIGIIKIEGVRR